MGKKEDREMIEPLDTEYPTLKCSISQRKREMVESDKTWKGEPRLSQIYYSKLESIGTLEKKFVLLCERKICAALLLEKMYDYTYWAIECSLGDDDEYHDPAIYNTIEGIADWFFGLFSVNEVEESIHYLVGKGYISATSIKDELKLEYNSAKVDKDGKSLQFLPIPIHTPQRCLEEKQSRAEERRHWKPCTVEVTVKEKDLEDEEKRKVNNHNKRAKNARLPATLTLEQWLETLEHFDWKCAYCGGKYDMLEHFIPLNHGKGTTWDNCVPACGSCNTKKQAWNPLNGWGPELTSIGEGIERVQAYLATRG